MFTLTTKPCSILMAKRISHEGNFSGRSICHNMSCACIIFRVKTTWLQMPYHGCHPIALVLFVPWHHVVWASGVKVTMLLSTDGSVLQAIKDGYKSDLSVIDYQRQAHLKLNVSGPATVRLHWSVEYITSCLQ